MYTFLTSLLLGCSESSDEKQKPALSDPAQSESPSNTNDSAQKPLPSHASLALDSYLAQHPERAGHSQDLSILFGEDRILTKLDLDHFKGASQKEISTRFLSEESDFVRDLSRILAPPMPQDLKYAALKAYLETGEFPGDVSKSISKTSSISWQLSPSNPINELIEIESVVHPELESQTRDYLKRVIYEVAAAWTPEMSPQKCLETTFAVMTSTRINGERIQIFGQKNDPLLCTNLDRNVLDCDTSAFVALAVAHELGWPVSIVLAPQHAFIAWENEGHFDEKKYYPEPPTAHRNAANMAPEAIAQGTYLRPLTTDELRGLYYNNRASYYLLRGLSQTDPGKKEADLRAFEVDIRHAIALSPKLEVAHHNFGLLALKQGDIKTACQEITKALKLDPSDESALSLRKSMGSCPP